jgi:putative hydrolase of the HAD superfamily
VALDAVVFDLDDTLIFEEKVARASLRKVVELLGAESGRADEVILATARTIWRAGPYWPACAALGFASWEGLWADFEGCHPSLEPLRAWVPRYRREVWRRSLEELEISDDDFVEEAEVAYQAFQRAGHRLRPGADATLSSLRTDLRLGLLTNGPPDVQRTKLATCGLTDSFDAVVISGEIGHGKPDPTAFGVVLDRLGVTPERSVMVGDSWERDVVGAESSGMRAVWVSGGRAVPEASSDHRIVASVGDITLDLLKELK